MDLIDPITVVDEEEDDNLEFEEGTAEFVENDDESNGDGGVLNTSVSIAAMHIVISTSY